MSNRPAKVLVVVMRYAYGLERKGVSYEYQNIYLPLTRMAPDVRLWDFLEVHNTKGKQAMNQELVAQVREFAPDLVLFCPYQEQFEEAALAEVRKHARTLCLFLDDNWRVEFSRRWAPSFDLCGSSDIDGERKFRDAGIPNVMFFPFGFDEEVYRRLRLPMQYDVSFIGAWHPRRAWLVQRLRKAGFDVYTGGAGWPSGPVSHDEMIRIFNQSRINLNLSNSISWDLRYLSSSPRALRDTLRSSKSKEQLKARHFELNGCGAFQLTQYAEGIERVFRIGEEIAIFDTPEDLEAKVRYFLAHREHREAIAEAGYRRAMAEHTCERYFSSAFARVLGGGG